MDRSYGFDSTLYGGSGSQDSVSSWHGRCETNAEKIKNLSKMYHLNFTLGSTIPPIDKLVISGGEEARLAIEIALTALSFFA